MQIAVATKFATSAITKVTLGLTLGGAWTPKILNALTCVVGGKVMNVQM